MPLSSSQFGVGDSDTPELDVPMSLGAATTGSIARQTAWRTPRRGQTPMSYSKRNSGTTFAWDDGTQPQMPTSDKGAGR